MVESQVRGVEIWGRYSIPVRNLIHSGNVLWGGEPHARQFPTGNMDAVIT